MEREVQLLIREKTMILGQKYPIVANYESRFSLWSCGLEAGLISKQLYDMAQRYYGDLWNYVGD